MKTGDIVIVSFPFTDLTSSKARPAVVVNVIEPNYNDVIVCLISSVIPPSLTSHQIKLNPDNINNLKAHSVVNVARITTLAQNKIIAVIGKLNRQQLDEFKNKSKSLVEVIK